MKSMRVMLAACILFHVGCFTVSVGDAPEQHAVTIGLVPSTGAAWHAEQDIQGRRPLTGGKRFTDALGMTAWAVFTNLVFIGIDSLRRDHMSLYGYHHLTSPHISKWAEGGTVFLSVNNDDKPAGDIPVGTKG